MTRARRVYSTGPDGARSERDDAVAAPFPVLPIERHALKLRLERSGRGGKTVSVVGPLCLHPEAARGLLAELKKRCGTGGTLKSLPTAPGESGFELEIQGDHVDTLTAELSRRGFPIKRAGG